jgi:hypothetical protein
MFGTLGLGRGRGAGQKLKRTRGGAGIPALRRTAIIAVVATGIIALALVIPAAAADKAIARDDKNGTCPWAQYPHLDFIVYGDFWTYDWIPFDKNGNDMVCLP